MLNSDIRKIIIENTPVLDVRAPIEFNEGHIPGAVCIPILDNIERAQVGTTYKEQGQEKAIELGHKLVSGKTKEHRISEWSNFLKLHENSIITCFRGGLRSKTAQDWLKDQNILRPRLEGGYKAFRKFIIQELETKSTQLNLTVLSGNTGSGKTKILTTLKEKRAIIDLEEYAHHRGSAFGSQGQQPPQALFENRLACQIIKLDSTNHDKILVEDESRLIGQNVQPNIFFERLRESPLVVVDEDIQARVENTFNEYILNRGDIFGEYKAALKRISNKLGGLKYEEILKDLSFSEAEWKKTGHLESNRVWIEKLLVSYYDPMYTESLVKRQPKVLFRGSSKEVLEFLTRNGDKI